MPLQQRQRATIAVDRAARRAPRGSAALAGRGRGQGVSLHEPSPLTSNESHACRVRHKAGFPGDRREARVRRCRSCDRGDFGIEVQAFAGVEPAGRGIAVRCSCAWSCPDHAGRPGFGNPNPAPFGASATTAICRTGDAACEAPTALPGCLTPARRARARTTACEHSPQSADSCAIRRVPDRNACNGCARVNSNHRPRL